MRVILLLVVLAGITWTANRTLEQFSHAIFIANYWQSDDPNLTEGLFKFDGEKAQLYAFDGVTGYWDITLTLWPVWLLFMLSFLILIPFSFLWYHWMTDEQIKAAKAAQRHAEETTSRKIQEANLLVDHAYEEQEKRIRYELSNQEHKINQRITELNIRERELRDKEIIARETTERAERQMANIQKEYATRVKAFNEEVTALTKSRDNAKAGFERLKRKDKQLRSWERRLGATLPLSEGKDI